MHKNVYIPLFPTIFMSRKKRVRKNKQRGMFKKQITGKKPMSSEQKAERKKISETQREASKTVVKKKVVKKE